MAVHVLKTWPEHFQAVVEPDPNKRKTVEIRKNDRNYEVGDILALWEFDPTKEQFSGRIAYRRVTHILIGDPWLPEGYSALSIRIDESLDHYSGRLVGGKGR